MNALLSNDGMTERWRVRHGERMRWFLLFFHLLMRDVCWLSRWWHWRQYWIVHITDFERLYSNNYWTWFLKLQVSRPFFSPFDRIMPFIKLISNIECNVFSGRISREYQFMPSLSSSSSSAFLLTMFFLYVLLCVFIHKYKERIFVCIL